MKENERYHLVETRHAAKTEGEGHAGGRLTAFHGQMGMFVRALSYMLSHGGDGIRQAAEDAVLNANYVLARLKVEMTSAFEGYCMHECLFDDDFLKGTGIETIDFAKAMIDEGYHPMTMYFPLVVHGAMLIEPTESEPKQELDLFCDALLSIARRAKAGARSFLRRAAGSMKRQPRAIPCCAGRERPRRRRRINERYCATDGAFATAASTTR